MDRRQFLDAGASAAMSSLAGCGSFGWARTVSEPTERVEGAPSELLVDAAVGIAEPGALGSEHDLEGRTRVPLP